MWAIAAGRESDGGDLPATRSSTSGEILSLYRLDRGRWRWRAALPAHVTRQVMENMKKVVEGAGGRMEDIAKMTVYITDIKYREAVTRVRQEFFKGDPPANTLVVISALADPAFLVEIEAIVPLP